MCTRNRFSHRIFLACAVALLITATTALCYAEAAIKTVKELYAPREPITVRFSGFSGHATDWITLASANTADNMFLEYQYTKGAAQGVLQFVGLQPGVYEARGYFDWEGTRSRTVKARYRFIVSAQERSAPTPGSTNAMGTSQDAKIQALEYAFKTFVLWVPGTSYVVDNFDRQTSTLYTSTGTIPKSVITINRDGTYLWNSAWDEKVINGRWTIESDGSLNLIKGQEGKAWKVEKGDGTHEDIFLMDGSIWYSGKAVTVKSKE